MSEFKREARYIVVKPDCEDSLRTERLKSYIDEMCFKTPDCVVVEADWPEYEPVWRMIESRVMGLPNELEYAQSELAALREELAKVNREKNDVAYRANETAEKLNSMTISKATMRNQLKQKLASTQQRLADAERRNALLENILKECTDCVRNGEDFDLPITTMARIDAALTKPEEAKS